MTVDAICEGAAQVFEARGYAGATTNHIAERAGVSIGTLYQYFADKDAVANAVLERHLAESMELVKPALARAMTLVDGVGLEEAIGVLRGLVSAIIQLHTRAPRLHRVLFEEIAWPPDVTAQLGQLEELLAAQLGILLAQYRGVTHPSPERAAHLVVLVVESLSHRYILVPPSSSGPLGTEEAFTDEVVEMLGRYLFAPPAIPS
jgi:AcrR family transcriptional regulator